jgi:hypothetical protein
VNTETKSQTEIRDSAGKFKKGVSGNPAGRKVGAKGKHSKAKLESMLSLAGPASLKKLQELAATLEERGDVGAAIKIHVYLSGKWFELLIHNEKVELQRAKQSDVDDMADTQEETYEGVVVKFGSVG